MFSRIACRPFSRFFFHNKMNYTISVSPGTYENVITEIHGKVGLVKLNRPKALNALNDPLIDDLNSALHSFQQNPDVGAIVITGNGRAFAAGADIKEMAPLGYFEIYNQRKFDSWEEITKIRKPIIGAINGFALGGGCELAMACDILLAGSSAKFGQPEIKLGVIPGVGGTQRLTKAIGKSRAMELILTGDIIDSSTAERYGLVSRVIPDDKLLEEALALGEKIASYSQPIAAVAKEVVNKSFDLPLSQGLSAERSAFYSIFSTEDQKEGMKAFIEKRTPNFKNK